MAGLSLGVTSPTTTPAPVASRTRRFHGAVALGDVPAVVYSLRSGDPAGVVLAIGAGGSGLALSGRLSAHQARLLARALTSAAEALEGPLQRAARGAA